MGCKMAFDVLKMFSALFLVFFGTVRGSNNLVDPCFHEKEPNVGTPKEMCDGCSVYSELLKNQTHLYSYENYDVGRMNQPDMYRNLIINLEPCKGVVYLFIRKTRRCFPNPYSCIDLNPINGKPRPSDPKSCDWTHFMSVIDGSRDGAPTFFELPLTSTKYYISVFAREKSTYTLTFLSDTGRWPRPGRGGEIAAIQKDELQVQVSWDEGSFRPMGVTDMAKYHIFSSMLLDDDNRTNAAVFLDKQKIMNTVCGLRNNTDRVNAWIPAERCFDGKCNATINGVIPGKRYIFNIVAESRAGFNMSYAGLILLTNWEVERKAVSDRTLRVVVAITSSVLGMIIIILLIISLNSRGKATIANKNV